MQSSSVLVLGETAAVSEAVVHSLRLRKAKCAPLMLHNGPVSRLAEWLGSAPELAIVIHSDALSVEGVVRKLKRHWPRVRVLALGVPNQESAVLRSVTAGADGIVLANESLGQLRQAVREVLTTGCRPSPQLLRPLVDRLIRLESKAGQHGGHPLLALLSTREGEILERLAQGNSNKQIAVHLNIEVQTVKNHLTRILRKLGVRSRADAARLAATQPPDAARISLEVRARKTPGPKQTLKA